MGDVVNFTMKRNLQELRKAIAELNKSRQQLADAGNQLESTCQKLDAVKLFLDEQVKQSYDIAARADEIIKKYETP